MRFGIRSGAFVAAALALVCSGAPAGATDIPIPGKITIIKDGKLAKLVAKPVGAFTIPGIGSAGDPVINGGEVNFFDTGGSGIMTDTLGGTWTGLGSPAGSKGWKYSNTSAPVGGAVKLIIMKTAVIKILAKDDGTVNGPLAGTLGITLETGTDNRCAEFGGTVIKNDPGLVKRKDAPAPGTCPTPGGGIFTCPGCNGHSYINFTTADVPGDCGDIIDSAGMTVANVNCAGLYTGGGGNSVPLPYDVPDLSSSTTKITTCTGSVATVSGASSVETGSDKDCSAAGCKFGAPLAVPNPGSTPTSVCVLNTLSAPASGTVDCASGATNISAPLSSVLFLTGDTATDPGSTIAGIQPCPLCTGGSCIGGPNNGMSCVAGTGTLGGNPSYPTSHDCPPDPMFNIGTLPVDFALTTGSVTWSGTSATNDTGSTVSVQNRVFSGFCRDADGTGAFAGSTPATAQECWKNGMAVGAACSGTFESCEQKNNGAFGPAGGANRTITAIGNGMSIIGGPSSATLVSIFSIRPTFDATVDAAGDLPGPGAVALPGTAESCADAMVCP
jgi:hypothetical protein